VFPSSRGYDPNLPIARAAAAVRATGGAVTWLLDRAAAAEPGVPPDARGSLHQGPPRQEELA
jgi:hypothetical protein